MSRPRFCCPATPSRSSPPRSRRWSIASRPSAKSAEMAGGRGLHGLRFFARLPEALSRQRQPWGDRGLRPEDPQRRRSDRHQRRRVRGQLPGRFPPQCRRHDSCTGSTSSTIAWSWSIWAGAAWSARCAWDAIRSASAFLRDAKYAWVSNVGMFEYPLLPGVTPKSGPTAGLSFPAYGVPSKEAEEGVVAEGKKIPGLGSPNHPDAMSVFKVESGDRPGRGKDQDRLSGWPAPRAISTPSAAPAPARWSRASGSPTSPTPRTIRSRSSMSGATQSWTRSSCSCRGWKRSAACCPSRSP